MKLCIAEKPSVAKEIANVLGAKNRKDGYFEGNGYLVSWTFGHLCGLKEPQDYDEKWKYWNLHTLPVIPQKFGIKLIANKGIEKQFNVLSKLINTSTEVINCGDAGQEGEIIQRWVLAKANNTKPVKRLWISSLTEEAIKEGFSNLKPSDQFDRLYEAGNSRAISDWLLGMNATRLYSIKYGNGKQVLSIGRVQTPTLALIVNRHLEIINFKPQTYWELKTKYRDVIFQATKGRFTNKEEAEEVLKNIKQDDFVIESTESKKGKDAPPRLFDLTSLQVECNKRFGYSADDTLKTIQSLYEKKVVSYPRVDTTYLPSDLYPKISGILKSLRSYNNLVTPLLSKPIKKSGKVFDDKKVTDHHAIIPTNNTASGLSGNELAVYDLIAKRFIAAFYPDSEFATTTVIGSAADIPFKVTGKQILVAGWRTVFGKEVNEDGADDEQVLPIFVKGEKGPHEPQFQEKQTQPPKPFTEATLLRAMETAGKNVDDEELREVMKDNGIGRPSTRAAVIETLFKRNYIRKEKKNLIPTSTGIDLIKTIKNELLKSAELTGQWEFKLRQIEKGEYKAADFLTDMKKMIIDMINQVKSQSSRKIISDVPSLTFLKDKNDEDVYCPKCKDGKVIKGKAAFGCSRFRENCNFLMPFKFEEVSITDESAEALLIKGRAKAGKSDEIHLTDEFKLEIRVKEKKEVKERKVKEKAAEVCFSCKSGNLIKGNAAYGCSNWKQGCKIRIPFTIMDAELNEVNAKKLFASGTLQNWKSGKGKKAAFNLYFDKSSQFCFEEKKD